MDQKQKNGEDRSNGTRQNNNRADRKVDSPEGGWGDIESARPPFWSCFGGFGESEVE